MRRAQSEATTQPEVPKAGSARTPADGGHRGVRAHARRALLAPIAAALLGACSDGPPASSYQNGPSGPVRTPAACVVTRIIDGDTIDCAPYGRVRLIGIDAPEFDQQPFARLATEALASLLPLGTEVLFERDVESEDPSGRPLGYIWSDAGLVNWIMVRDGFAVVLTYPPNVQYVEWLEAARAAAASDQLGLWEIHGFDCEPLQHRRGRC
jgi:micrococcal nuclease